MKIRENWREDFQKKEQIARGKKKRKKGKK